MWTVEHRSGISPEKQAFRKRAFPCGIALFKGRVTFPARRKSQLSEFPAERRDGIFEKLMVVYRALEKERLKSLSGRNKRQERNTFSKI